MTERDVPVRGVAMVDVFTVNCNEKSYRRGLGPKYPLRWIPRGGAPRIPHFTNFAHHTTALKPRRDFTPGHTQ